jgi:hypothetical protein
MAFGDIRSKEVQATQEKDQQAASIQVSTDVLDEQVQQTSAAPRQSGSAALGRGSAAPTPRSGSAAPERGSAAPGGAAVTSTPTSPLPRLDRTPIFEEEDVEEPVHGQSLQLSYEQSEDGETISFIKYKKGGNN